MRAALHAEWTKLRTTPGPAWLLLAALAATIVPGAAAAAAMPCPDRACGLDPTRLSLAGLHLGQAPIAILAVLTMAGEHSTGLIGTTLAAVPRRLALLTAKATILIAAVAACGATAALAALLTARPLLPDALAGGPILAPWAGSVAYLVLIALLGLGTGTAVRDPAAAIGIVLGLLYLPPILAFSIADPHWQRLLHRLAPMRAGHPWDGLAPLAAWTAAALLTGALALQRRDPG